MRKHRKPKATEPVYLAERVPSLSAVASPTGIFSLGDRVRCATMPRQLHGANGAVIENIREGGWVRFACIGSKEYPACDLQEWNA